ncbi:MAG: sulfatase-like hydrolase/transferase [Gemmataceae bacterium]
MRQRPLYWFVLVFACLGVLFFPKTSQAAGKKGERPNVIVIMADDLGYECLSCNGGAPYKTPVLDELAANGLRFTNCVSEPLCTPSRVTIMTGRYNFRNYTRFGIIQKTEKTFGNIMKQAGYATCIVGKWQLGYTRNDIQHFGFDEYCLWHLEGKTQRYTNFGKLVQNGKVRKSKQGEYGPDAVSNFMLDFITRNKDNKFFCYYPMMLTHNPFVPTPDSKNPGTKKGKRQNGKYMIDMVAYTDTIIGRLVKHLEKLKLRENTVIIFTGDNGTNRSILFGMVGELNWPGGKGSLLNETGVRVPLVVNWPAGRQRGKVFNDPVDFTDILPTVAELAGAKLPKDVKIDGHSFAGRLRGDKTYAPRKWAYNCYYGRARRTALQCARDTRYKLYEGGQFFDFVTDPLHKKPLDPKTLDKAGKASHAALSIVLEKMRKEIRIADKKYPTKTILLNRGQKLPKKQKRMKLKRLQTSIGNNRIECSWSRKRHPFAEYPFRKTVPIVSRVHGESM